LREKKGGEMKRLFFVSLIAIFSLSIVSISFCEETGEGKGKEMKEHKMDKGKMMMKKIMSKEIVATQDGGVVVMMGNKLIKYDKKLNLVKEIELKMDMDAMKKHCQMSDKAQKEE